MLIISRNPNKRDAAYRQTNLVLPDGTVVVVEVVEVRRNGDVRLGFTAPQSVAIERGELAGRWAGGSAAPAGGS